MGPAPHGRAFSILISYRFGIFSLSQKIVEEEKINRVRYKIVGDEALSLATGDQEAVKELLRRSGLPEDALFYRSSFSDHGLYAGHFPFERLKLLLFWIVLRKSCRIFSFFSP